MGVTITKMQSCGNDFVLLDYNEFLKFNLPMKDLAKKICDRHFGIGADGLIIPNENTKSNADIGWYFYNADGSTVQMSGNGITCFSRYIYDKGLVNDIEFTVQTFSGIIKSKVMDNENIMINMSKPILDTNLIPFLPNHNLNYKFSLDNRIFEGNAISVGTPHFVIFVYPEDDILKLAKNYGHMIETGAEFPEKTNVDFVKIKSYKKIELVVWERGCGITYGCSTGACASVIAGILNAKLENCVDVILPGGSVQVVWNGSPNKPEGDIFLVDSAKYSFVAEVDDNLFI